MSDGTGQVAESEVVLGNQTFVLLPVNNNKHVLQWKGPFEVKQVLYELHYIPDVEVKLRTVQAHIVKPFTESGAHIH